MAAAAAPMIFAEALNVSSQHTQQKLVDLCSLGTVPKIRTLLRQKSTVDFFFDSGRNNTPTRMGRIVFLGSPLLWL
jgi:hypothetical protein